MQTVTSSIYSAAGAPAIGASISGTCRTCGVVGNGIDFLKWVKPTFTDWDKLTAGGMICHACKFCFDDSNTALDAKIGKTRQRMRNYSHFVLNGEWIVLSKGQKTKMIEVLSASPQVAVIAASGQKHIIFRAAIGMWQFEETSILPDITELHRYISLIEPLYKEAGFAKSEIASGRYNQKRVMEFGLNRWRDLDNAIRQRRGSKLFSLAMFLVQKEKESTDDADIRSDSGQPAMAMLEGFE